MIRLTDKEVLALLRSDTTIEKARKVFAGYVGHFEQFNIQSPDRPLIEKKREEYEAIAKIIQTAGIPEVLAAAKLVLADWQAGRLVTAGTSADHISAATDMGTLISALRSVEP